MLYEKLLTEAYNRDIDTYEKHMNPNVKGLYADNNIWINKKLSTNVEKACILAEELGHYHTSDGDIIDQRAIESRKQEKRARKWAHKRLVPLYKIIEAYECGVRSRFELAEYLDVTETFLIEAIKRYKEEYGLFTTINQHTIYFEPLAVLKMWQNEKE